MKPRISILIPVKDEQNTLPRLLDALNETLRPLSDQNRFHVLILDDGSTDDTVKIAKETRSDCFSVGLCSLTRNFGKEAAIAAGLERCDSDAYIVMDGDLQHPPELIPEMLQHWQKGYKVVEAVKADRGKESLFYRLFSLLFYRSMKFMATLDLQSLSDYKLIDREVVHTIRRLPEKSRFFRGLIDWMGYPTHHIPFDVPVREHGNSSWSTIQLIKYSISSVASFSSAPLQMVTLIGMLMLLVSVILGSVTLFQWISGSAVTGFTTVIILLLMIGSMLMVSLGVIGLYLSKIYEEIKGRPSYMVKEEFQLSPDSDQ